MREDLDAEVSHHALTEKTGQHGLAIREQELEYERHGEDRCARDNEPSVVTWNGNVDHALCKRGSYELKHSICEQQDKRPDDERAIWPSIPKKSPHEATVVRFAECFFFVNIGGSQRLSL